MADTAEEATGERHEGQEGMGRGKAYGKTKAEGTAKAIRRTSEDRSQRTTMPPAIWPPFRLAQRYTPAAEACCYLKGVSETIPDTYITQICRRQHGRFVNMMEMALQACNEGLLKTKADAVMLRDYLLATKLL